MQGQLRQVRRLAWVPSAGSSAPRLPLPLPLCLARSPPVVLTIMIACPTPTPHPFTLGTLSPHRALCLLPRSTPPLTHTHARPPDRAQAVKHLERVLEISREIRDFVGDADAYGTIAGGARWLAEVPGWLRWRDCGRGGHFLRVGPSPVGLSLPCLGFHPLPPADIYTDMGDFDRAAHYYDKYVSGAVAALLRACPALSATHAALPADLAHG